MAAEDAADVALEADCVADDAAALTEAATSAAFVDAVDAELDADVALEAAAVADAAAASFDASACSE